MISSNTEYVVIEIAQLPRVLATFTVRRKEEPATVRRLILAALEASDFDPFSVQTMDNKLTIHARGL